LAKCQADDTQEGLRMHGPSWVSKGEL